MTIGDDDGPFSGLGRATQAVETIRDALGELGEDRKWLIPWVMEGVSGRSIASEVLAFAIGGRTSGCSSGRACARLYLALQGYPIDLRDTTTAFDLTRQSWWLRAMFEFSTTQWQGTRAGVQTILHKHPELRRATPFGQVALPEEPSPDSESKRNS